MFGLDNEVIELVGEKMFDRRIVLRMRFDEIHHHSESAVLLRRRAQQCARRFIVKFRRMLLRIQFLQCMP